MFKEKRFVNFDTPHSEQSLSEAAAEGRKEKAEREARKQDPKKVEAAKARLKAQEEKAKEGEAKRLAELETSLGGADMAIQRAETSTKEFDKMFPELKEAIVTERVQAKEKAAEVKERGTLAERRRQDSARMFILYKALEVRTKTKRPLSLKDMSDAITKHFEAGNRAPITEKSLETAAEKFVQAEMERIKNEPDLIQSEEEIAKRAELIRARVEETKQRILAEIKSGKTARYEEEFVESAASEDVDSLLAGLGTPENKDMSLFESIKEPESLQVNPDGSIEVSLGKVSEAELIKKLKEGEYFTDLGGNKAVGLYNKRTGARTVAVVESYDDPQFTGTFGGPDLVSGRYLIKKGEKIDGTKITDAVVDKALVQRGEATSLKDITPVPSNPDLMAAEENLSDNETLVSKVEFLQSQLLEKYKGYDEAIQTLNTAVESLNGQLAIEKVPEVANKIIEIIAQHKAKIVEVERARSAGYDFVVNEVGMLLKTAKTLESVSREIAESGKIDPSAVERNRFERNNTYEALESIEKGLVALPNVGAQMLTESRNSVSSAQHEIDTLASSLVAKDHEENEQRSSKLTERLAKLEEKKSVLVKPEDFDGQFAEASKTLQEAEKTYSVLLAKPGAGPKTAEIGRIAKEYLAKGLQDSKRVAGLHDEAQKAYSQAIDAGKKFQEAVAGGKSDQVIQELESDFETKRKAADVLGNEMESARLGALSSVGTAKVLYTEAEKAYNEDREVALAKSENEAYQKKLDGYFKASESAKVAAERLAVLVAEKERLGPSAPEAKLTELDGKIAAAKTEVALKEQQAMAALSVATSKEEVANMPYADVFDGKKHEQDISAQLLAAKKSYIKKMSPEPKNKKDDPWAALTKENGATSNVKLDDVDYARQALSYGTFKEMKGADGVLLSKRFGELLGKGPKELHEYLRRGVGAVKGSELVAAEMPALAPALQKYTAEVMVAVGEDLADAAKAKLDNSSKLDAVVNGLKDFVRMAYNLKAANQLGVLVQADYEAALVKLNESRSPQSIALEYSSALTKANVVKELNSLVQEGYIDPANFVAMDLAKLQEIATGGSAHRSYLNTIASQLPGGIDKYKRTPVEQIQSILATQAGKEAQEQGSLSRKADLIKDFKSKAEDALKRGRAYRDEEYRLDAEIAKPENQMNFDLEAQRTQAVISKNLASSELLYYKARQAALENGVDFDASVYRTELENRGLIAKGTNITEPGEALKKAIEEKDNADYLAQTPPPSVHSNDEMNFEVVDTGLVPVESAYEEAKNALSNATELNKSDLQAKLDQAAIEYAKVWAKREGEKNNAKGANKDPDFDPVVAIMSKLTELGILADSEFPLTTADFNESMKNIESFIAEKRKNAATAVKSAEASPSA